MTTVLVIMSAGSKQIWMVNSSVSSLKKIANATMGFRLYASVGGG